MSRRPPALAFGFHPDAVAPARDLFTPAKTHHPGICDSRPAAVPGPHIR
jgi:hypothetical protein